MISREWVEPAIAASVDEWRRGREADPTLAPRGVPDLSRVIGYSLDDLRYNCVGVWSPAQRQLATRTLLLRLFWTGVALAISALMLAHGGGVVSGLMVIALGAAALKTLFDLEETWAGQICQVDGDIWTELEPDSEGPDQCFLHVGDLKLEITEDAYGALLSGGPYRIYYMPRAKKAVGGQVLPAWRPLPSPITKRKRWWQRFSIELS